MAENQVSIFNIGENREAMNASMFREKFVSNVFDPKLQNMQDTDTFIIRPLPYVHNPLKSVANKGFYALSDELGVFVFDSRTTFNRPNEGYYEFCEPSDLWLKLRNSKDPNISGRTSMLRKQQSNYCYIQIVNYPKDPSLNGQIRVFRMPMELVKAMNTMANPTDQQRALGIQPVQPFDMFNGKNITCSIVGHMEGSTLMRKWTVTPDQNSSELQLPLGPNGTMLGVSKCSQEAVLALFNEHMKEDLNEIYGYHEPTIDVKRRMKNYLRRIVTDIPVLKQVVEGYFPELNEAAALDQNANTSPTMMPNQPVAQPVAQPIPQPVAQPISQPVAQPVQQPTVAPTVAPTMAPTVAPVQQPAAPQGIIVP